MAWHRCEDHDCSEDVRPYHILTTNTAKENYAVRMDKEKCNPVTAVAAKTFIDFTNAVWDASGKVNRIINFKYRDDLEVFGVTIEEDRSITIEAQEVGGAG